MRITSSGNVGIGTTNPQNKLDVNGGISLASGNLLGFVGDTALSASNYALYGDSSHTYLNVASGGIISFLNNNAAQMTILNNGNVGINTTAPGNYLAISTSTNLGTISEEFDGTSQYGGGFNDKRGGSTSDTMFNFLRNNTSVGTIAETDTATAYNTTSDRRLKENIATTTAGLATLMQIPVDDFNFINDPSERVQGFIAQSLLPIYPEAVTTNGDNGIIPLGATSTPWSVDYGRITPLIVQAVQDIANITSTFQQNLVSWLGNAQNGIDQFFANVGNFHTVNSNTDNTQQLCLTDGPTDQSPVCVTKAQLAAVLSAQGPAANTESVTSSDGADLTNSGNPDNANSSSGVPASSTTPDLPAQAGTPPVIQINGDNPATIQVGATYADLGATITGPQADLNLATYVNGVPTNPVQLVTTEAATDTISYVATDQSGLTSTSTRTVIVQAPPAFTPPPTTEASSTTATTTAQ